MTSERTPLADETGQIPDQDDPAGSAPPGRRGRLIRNSDFNKLWLGQAVSASGSQITLLALPLTAVIYLHAGAFQLGLLNGAGQLSFLGPMLLFGVLADRVRRRWLMIGSDIGRAALLLLIPLLAWAGSLAMPVLYLVALTTGCLTSVFFVAYHAYLPSIVDPETLLAGNSRLQATESISDVAGPGVAGVLIQLLRAPFAILIDAGSFVFSAAMVASIRKAEPPPPPRAPAVEGERWLQGVMGDIGSGLSFAFGHAILRPLALAAATFNFFAQLMLTLFVLYAVRVAHMSPSQIGIVFAAFGIGGITAAITLDRAVTRLGYGRVLAAGYVVGALSIIGLPFVTGSPTVRTVLFTLLFLVSGCSIVALNIVEMTVRQAATPDSAQGRVTAGFGFIIGAVIPVAAVVAGLLGEHLGLRFTLFIAAAGVPFAVPWLIFSPIRRLRTLDDLDA